MESTVKSRVLFVDDEPRVLTTMKMLFRNHHELFFADSGQKALELLKTQPVDVIVSDQRMPGMTGIEMLRAARELNPNAMRILLTGYSDLNAIIGSINDGEIFRFVNKPWNNDELTNTVARAVVAARASAAASPLAAAPMPGSPSAASSSAPPAAAGSLAGILVLDEDTQVPGQIQAIVGEQHKVFGATTMEGAADVLEHQKIGVVISDTRVDDHPVLNLIATLKKHHPELVSVILTDHADAGTAIGLINQGQIYRYVVKPVSSVQAKIAVTSAIKQHDRLRQNPALTQRFEVEKSPEPAPASAGVLSRIRGLISRQP